MRIGIFTDDFYPESGGVSRSIQLQLQELAAVGHRVTLFAPAAHFKPPRECAWHRTPHWHLPGAPSFLCTLQVSPSLARRITAEHQDLEVVHSQNERGSIFLAAGMRELMDDRPRLDAMSAASAALGRRLGSATMRGNYLTLYRQAIAGHDCAARPGPMPVGRRQEPEARDLGGQAQRPVLRLTAQVTAQVTARHRSVADAGPERPGGTCSRSPRHRWPSHLRPACRPRPTR